MQMKTGTRAVIDAYQNLVNAMESLDPSEALEISQVLASGKPADDASPQLKTIYAATVSSINGMLSVSGLI